MISMPGRIFTYEISSDKMNKECGTIGKVLEKKTGRDLVRYCAGELIVEHAGLEA